MYGTMENVAGTNQQPLLAGPQQNHGRNNATATTTLRNRREGMARTMSARTGPVLISILEKPKRRESIPEQHNNNPNNNQGSLLEVAEGILEDDDEPSLLTLTSNKSFMYTMLNPRSDAWQAKLFKWFITIVIISDLVSFVISTEPDLSEYHQHMFHVWEGVTSSIFLIEYTTRLIVVTEAKKYRERGFLWGRLSYACTYSALIDFFATFPFFLELTTGLDLPTLTYLRAFRLLRILKTSGFTEATRAVYRVCYYNRQILYVALLICVGLVLLTAVLMYYLRPKDPDHSQQFTSLGSTMYLSTLMLTGQGGPEGDMPWYTKGVVLLTGIFSIGMFAIPASMLTWGFEAEAERMAQLAYVKRRHPEVAAAENDNWSFSSDDYSTDEEYRRIIAGGDDEEDENEDAEARKKFSLADVDGSGSISLTEFLALSREQATQQAAGGSTPSGAASHHLFHNMVQRMDTFERRLEANSQKLDKIVQLLEGMQKGKQ